MADLSFICYIPEGCSSVARSWHVRQFDRFLTLQSKMLTMPWPEQTVTFVHTVLYVFFMVITINSDYFPKQVKSQSYVMNDGRSVSTDFSSRPFWGS